MIARIVVASGNARKAIALTRDRDDRRSVTVAIRNALFPTNAAYGQAKRRGERAMGVC